MHFDAIDEDRLHLMQLEYAEVLYFYRRFSVRSSTINVFQMLPDHLPSAWTSMLLSLLASVKTRMTIRLKLCHKNWVF